MEAGDIEFVVKRGGKGGSQNAILQITLRCIFYLLFVCCFLFIAVLAALNLFYLSVMFLF